MNGLVCLYMGLMFVYGMGCSFSGCGVCKRDGVLVKGIGC